MKNLLIFFILGLLFVSCSPCKRLARKCPPQIITERYDSIIFQDTIIYKDKIVPYYVKGDTVKVDKPVPVKQDISPVFAQNKYASAKAWVKESRLNLQLILRDQVIQFKLDSAYMIAQHWEKKYKTEKRTEIIREKYIPKFYKIATFLLILGVVIFVGYIIYRFKKFKPNFLD